MTLNYGTKDSAVTDFLEHTEDSQECVLHLTKPSQNMFDVPRTNIQQELMRPLSIRECEVFRWLAAGKSGPEIAIILYISVCTVRIHIRNILSKLEASNIPHAIAKGTMAGLLLST